MWRKRWFFFVGEMFVRTSDGDVCDVCECDDGDDMRCEFGNYIGV